MAYAAACAFTFKLDHVLASKSEEAEAFFSARLLPLWDRASLEDAIDYGNWTHANSMQAAHKRL